jgi:hypothetical protein
MDYEILTLEEKCSRTDMIEIGPGKYSGKHWQVGFIFLDESDFMYAEEVIHSFYADYDHYEMNTISTKTGVKIVEGWRELAKQVPTLPVEELVERFRFRQSSVEYERINRERENIEKYLLQLSTRVETILSQDEFFCILGV